MVKKYTLHLDALVVIGLLFLASVLANIFLIKMNSDTGKQLIDVQSELILSQLNLSSSNEELAACQKKLDINTNKLQN
jgi:hypothetical protein